MSEWKTYKLREIAYLRKEQVVARGKEQPYIGLEHIEQQKLRLSGIGSSKDVISNKFKFYNGDILYGKLRPYFRKVYKPKFDGVCSTDIYVINNKSTIDDLFLYYLIATEEFTNIANSGCIGTRMPRADWSQLENTEWKIPESIDEQHRIASIFSFLDDKIDLLQQMNQTLEAIAQAIFKEWFVDFNFPRFDGEMVDGVPKGWRMGKLGEMANKISKGTTPTQEDLENLEVSVPFLKVKDINDNGVVSTENLELIPIEVHNKQLKRSILETNDILFSIAGTIGRVAILDNSLNDSNCNQAIAFIRLDDKEKYLEFVYLWLKNEIIQNFINSSIVQGVQANVSLTVLSNIDIIIPDEMSIRYWINVIKPIFSKITNNQHQIRTLTQLRDTLLPKLMSRAVEI